MRRIFAVTIAAMLAVAATAQSSERPGLAEQLAATSFKCGTVVKSKDYGHGNTVLVVGEFHYMRDIQDDVYCLIRQITLAHFVSFIGLEGVPYEGGTILPWTDLGYLKPVNAPFVGIEGSSWTPEQYGRIKAIDNRHKVLAKRKMEGGLSGTEAEEYRRVSDESYAIIVRGRSHEWVDNVKELMERRGLPLGILKVGEAHLGTVAERLDQYGISYVLLEPHAAKNYILCEAYWTKQRPRGDTRTNAEICADPKITARWD